MVSNLIWFPQHLHGAKNIQINECKTPILLIIGLCTSHLDLSRVGKESSWSLLCVPNPNATDPREGRSWVIRHKARNLVGSKTPTRPSIGGDLAAFLG